jgi:hypothetical protein
MRRSMRDAEAVDEVLHCAGHQHLMTFRKRRDPRPDVHRDAADVVPPHLTFAGVQAAADFDPELRHARGECGGTPNGACWPVEGRQKAVAGVLDRAALEPADLLAGRYNT